MYKHELAMVSMLKELKESYHVVGIKAEFEAEGSRLDEVIRLKDIAHQARLELTIKIGGCEAIYDMRQAAILGVSHIVAPMIETPYALQKYALAISHIASYNIGALINIETITSANNLTSMAQSPYFAQIQGIVLGRVDMAGSLGLSRDAIHSKQMLDIATHIARICKEHNKELIIGGGISLDSLAFLASLPPHALTRFETRKIIFSAEILEHPYTSEGLQKAVAFELAWLKYKRAYYQHIYEEDASRIAMLEARLART